MAGETKAFLRRICARLHSTPTMLPAGHAPSARIRQGATPATASASQDAYRSNI